MDTHYCYIVVNGSYPVEAFLDKDSAIECVRQWTGDYPSSKIYIFRCPLSIQKRKTSTLSNSKDENQEHFSDFFMERKLKNSFAMFVEDSDCLREKNSFSR